MSFLWDDPPRVIAHRGAPREAPENTLSAFRAAVDAGAAAVELDARVTADGHVVVHHDAALGRIVDGNGFVEDLALDELRALDAGARFAPAFRGTRVPTLDEVVRALPSDVLLDVELKPDANNAHELPRRVLDVVDRHDARERVLVTSFEPELADAYARLADRPAGIIMPFVPEADDLDAWPRLSFVALAQDAAIEEAFELVGKLSRRALVWTVNDVADAQRVLALGAAGVITDRPAALLPLLSPGAPARPSR